MLLCSTCYLLAHLPSPCVSQREIVLSLSARALTVCLQLFMHSPNDSAFTFHTLSAHMLIVSARIHPIVSVVADGCMGWQVARGWLGDSGSMIFSVAKAALHILEAYKGQVRVGVLNSASARKYHKVYPSHQLEAVLLLLLLLLLPLRLLLFGTSGAVVALGGARSSKYLQSLVFMCCSVSSDAVIY